eukprot:14699718-Alexandrium_andersonii.AAC.1
MICTKARAQSSITVAGSSLVAGAKAPGLSPSKGSGPRNAGAREGRASAEGGLAGGLGTVASSAASVSGES